MSRRGRYRAAPARVELCIDELVLHGVAAGDVHRITAAIERELGVLIGDRGVPPGLMETTADEAPAPAIVLRPGARPEDFGRRVAGAIYRAVAPSVRTSQDGEP